MHNMRIGMQKAEENTMTTKTTKRFVDRWYFVPSMIVCGLVGGPAVVIYFHFAFKFVDWVTK